MQTLCTERTVSFYHHALLKRLQCNELSAAKSRSHLVKAKEKANFSLVFVAYPLTCFLLCFGLFAFVPAFLWCE